MFFNRLTIVASLAGLMAGAVGPVAAQEGWKPTETVEIVVPSSPGGGNDTIGRTLQAVLKELGLTDTIVTNLDGAGGARAYAYVAQNTGNPHIIGITRTGLSSNHIIGRSPISHNELTVLSMVTDDNQAIAVHVDSPLQNINDLVAALKADPKSLGISVGSSRAAVAEVLVAKIVGTAGIDPTTLKIVTFPGSSESVAALLGGHVDVVSNPIASVVEFHEAGQLRILAIAAPERPASLPDVPTLRDQGLDITQNGWGGVTAPPGLTPEQVAYWEDMLDKVTQHPLWTKMDSGKFVDRFYLPSAEAKVFLDEDYAELKAILDTLGVVQ